MEWDQCGNNRIGKLLYSLFEDKSLDPIDIQLTTPDTSLLFNNYNNHNNNDNNY